MKCPLHYQTSEYDCVPTTFLNAITYLFGREAIPPMVVRHIFLYSLDTVSRHGRLGRGGTSSEAIRLLGSFLGRYKTSEFSVSTDYLHGEEVHLRRGSRIIACLNDGGVALCNIHLTRTEWHYILALKAQKDWILFFDPYRRLALRGLRGNVRILRVPGGRGPNLAISRAWLNGNSRCRRFCFGPKHDRECLLMWRKRRSARRIARAARRAAGNRHLSPEG
jgi:hypothetical protein